MLLLETDIAKRIAEWGKTQPMVLWAMQVKGIGPILAAGLCAFIMPGMQANPDIKTVGHLWRFAGIDPTCKWNPHQKRPWNATLKTICWKIGQSFVKNWKRDGAYGQVWLKHKEIRVEKNLRGDYRELAAQTLKTKQIEDAKTRSWYEKGMLPPGRIHLQACRKAVKLFLAHWFDEAYYCIHKERPPLPYPIAMLGHSGLIKSFVSELEEIQEQAENSEEE